MSSGSGHISSSCYLNIAEGSLAESRYYLLLARDLGYGEDRELFALAEEVARLLASYAKVILSPDA